MRRPDEPEQEARLLARAIALLRTTATPVTFAELCHGLGCGERRGGDRDHVVMNGSARRERQRLQRVLVLAEQQGIVQRDGDRLQLRSLDEA